MQRSLMRKALREHWPEYLIEAAGLGVFLIVVGMFATILEYPGSPVHQAIANPNLRRLLMGMVAGTTAISIVYSPWGKRSGAHLNPAVTLTFFRLKKIAPWDALFYAIAQFIGGTVGILLAAIVLGQAFSDPPLDYLVTKPGEWGIAVAFLTEVLLSFCLVLMVLFTSNINSLSNYTGIFAGMMVATYITLAAPLSGMSINPARSFASAFHAQIWTAFWIYYFAPPLGMLLAAQLYLRYPKKPPTLCFKLCPNGEQNCISMKCCGSCDVMIRHWRQEQ